ncbi:DUF429 domain-containing protein [Cyanobium sp. FGCU-6]|nr:DUF429 domain-containing protein [Cyanobium sp. FGCU6]
MSSQAVSGDLAGVDGCRAGWLVVRAPLAGGEPRADLLADVANLLLGRGAPVLTAIDMPIGLPDAGARACDRQARRLLGPGRGSSVFPAPIRPMLQAVSQAEASAIGRRIDGRGLTIQAWNLMPRIQMLDGLLAREPALATRLREAHPELIFQLWAGRPLAWAKRRPEGRAERLALVQSRWPGAWARCRAALPRGGWADDDLLDAFACLHAAGRLHCGVATVLGGEKDGCGRVMEICA